MDGQSFRDRIGQKRVNFNKKYDGLIRAVSKVGASSQKGEFSSFGPIYETFMYAFIIGYKLGVSKPLESGERVGFNDFVDFKPTPIRDFVLMLLLNKSEEFGFKWIELENASEDTINTFVTELIRQMEGYANAGFEYLQNKWDNENMKFRNPFVFVNFIEELSQS